MVLPVRTKLISQKDHQIYLGTFIQNSTSMIISDPSFELSGPSMFGETYQLNNVKPGTYHCWTIQSNLTFENLEDPGHTFSNLENTCLICLNQQYLDFKLNWKRITDVPVETGQAGIYDLQAYHPNKEDWYDLNNLKTASPIGAGLVPSGVVSSAGGGDGTYEAYAALSNNQVVAVKINFN